MALSKQEQEELAQLQKETEQTPGNEANPGLSDAEKAELESLQKEFPEPAPSLLDRGAQALGAVGKLFDVQRGLTGGPLVGQALEKVYPGKKVYSKEDILNAINPKNLKGFPTTSEMLARAGVGEKGSLSDVIPGAFETPGGEGQDRWYVPNKGGLLDVTGRGTIGLATDILSDPTTYESGGLMAIPKIAEKILPESLAKILPHVAMPITSGLEKAGKSIYESGIRPVVQAGEDFGKKVAGTYYEKGIRGTPRQMQGQAEKVLADLKNKSNQIIAAANEKGVKLNVNDVLKPQIEKIDEMVKKGGILTAAEGDKLKQDLFDRYVRGTEVTPDQLVNWKESLYQGIPNSAYREGERTTLERGMDKQFANQLKTQAENLVDMGTPGAGKNLAEVNRGRGDLLTTRKALKQMVKRSESRPLITPMDLAFLVGGSGLGLVGEGAHGLGFGAAAISGKKAYDVLRSPTLRTTLGYNTAKAAENPVLAPIIEGGARRLLTSPGSYYGRLLKNEDEK